MKRTQIYIDESQDALLEDRALAEGTTKSAVIRTAVDAYLAQPLADRVKVSRFREAVRAAAGTATHLPPGDRYVAELRAAERRRGG